MEEIGASQLSIIHPIREFQMANQVTDHGLLESTMQEIKNSDLRKNVEVVADKGYEASEDTAGCYGKGIIPHVIADDGKDGYEIEIPYGLENKDFGQPRE